jgi:NUDIX domain
VAKVIEGERIGKLGRLALGGSPTIFDPTRQKVLLTRRTDNERWCLPGGHTEAGESVVETCLHGPMQESQHADDDQIDGDDIVQQPRHDENQDPGDEGDDWLEGGMERHINPPYVQKEPLLGIHTTADNYPT